jgi:hypothetical protein
MENLLTTIKQTRKNFIQLIERSSAEELNRIPAGFNNNMIWNFGHIIASQQILCYKLAGIAPRIDQKYILDYQKGTKPEEFIDTEEINFLKGLMLGTIDELADDLKNNIFINYSSMITSYGVELKSAADAVQFFPVHDAFHYGCASSIKKALNNK